MKRALAALVVLFGSLLWLDVGLSTAQPAGDLASGVDGCVETHTVRPGETLTSIAARHNQTLNELWQRNRHAIQNPDLVRVGQILCIRTATPGEEWVRAFVSVDYRYTVEPGEDGIIIGNRAGLISKRTIYPLQPAGVQMFATPALLTAALQGRQPLLYGVDLGEDGFALVQVGDEPFLAATHSAFAFGLENAQGEAHTIPIGRLVQQARLGTRDEYGSGPPLFVLTANTDGESYGMYAVSGDLLDPPPIAVSPSFTNHLVIEARYQVAESGTQAALPTLWQGSIQRRLVFTLPSVSNVITGLHTVSDVTDLLASIEAKPAPLLYATRKGDTTSYRLVLVGDSTLLEQLRPPMDAPLSPPAGCNTASHALLSKPGYPLESLTAYLETENGLRYPYPVNEIGIDQDDSGLCMGIDDPVFALHSASDGRYEAIVLLTEEGFGPPGEGRSLSCSRWQRGSGWRYLLLLRIFGC
jgi:hypothetical protein